MTKPGQFVDMSKYVSHVDIPVFAHQYSYQNPTFVLNKSTVCNYL